LVFDSGPTVLDGAGVSSRTLTSFILPEVEAQGFHAHLTSQSRRGSGTLTLDREL